jgi:integrase
MLPMHLDGVRLSGGTLLPPLTPHGLRRSFASLLYAIGELFGHNGAILRSWRAFR